MIKSFWQWFLTNRAVAFVVITASQALTIAAYLTLKRHGLPSLPDEPMQFLSLRDFGCFATQDLPLALICASPLVGLFRCNEHGLELRVWWSGVRHPLRLAVFVGFLGWLGGTLAQNNPGLHQRMEAFFARIGPSVMILIYTLMVLGVLWVVERWFFAPRAKTAQEMLEEEDRGNAQG